MSLSATFHIDFTRIFMVKAQEPWATQGHISLHMGIQRFSLCFAGVDSNSLWSTYEKQN